MSAFDVTGSAGPTVAEILGKLGADPKTGLSPSEVQERLNNYGPNALPEEKKSALSALLAYFLFPTELRATASGFAAGVAKIGATLGVFVLPIIKGKFVASRQSSE